MLFLYSNFLKSYPLVGSRMHEVQKAKQRREEIIGKRVP
jgi:hypothetical protein